MTDSNSSNTIWVATNGRTNAAGTASDPFNSINLALKNMTPGATIVLKSGNYTESVYIDDTMSGTVDHPLTIKAAEGPGTVQITGQHVNTSTFFLHGASNVVISDLSIVGVGLTDARDDAPIKVAIKNEQVVPTNITIEGNTISGTGRDAIKLASVDDVHIINNEINGNFGQELIDLFSTHGAEVAGNVFNAKAGYSAICMKAGGEDIKISGNLFQGDYDFAIKVGGQVGDTLESTPLQISLGRSDVLQASGVEISGNIMLGRAENDVRILGGQDVVVTDNYFGSVSKFGPDNIRIASVAVQDFEMGTFRESFADDVLVYGNVSTRPTMIKDTTADALTADENLSLYKNGLAQDLLRATMEQLYLRLEEQYGSSPGQLALARYVSIDDEATPPPPAPDLSVQDIARVLLATALHTTADQVSGAVSDHLADFLGPHLSTSDLLELYETLNSAADASPPAMASIAAASSRIVAEPINLVDGILQRYNLDLRLGAAENTSFKGTASADFLFGSDGADILGGGKGNDTIVFGGGADRGMGGQGADTFIFTAMAKSAIIRDFSAQDKLIIETNQDVVLHDLFDSAIEKNGMVRLKFGNQSILFENTTLEDLQDYNIVLHS